jgi:hypothetical protein
MSRIYPGKAEAQTLIEALNATPSTPFSESLRIVLEAAQQFTEGWQAGSPDKALVRVINEFFARYRMCPQFEPTADIDVGFSLETRWTTLKSDKGTNAVLALHDIIAYYWPERLQRCAQCNNWIYRHTPKHRCCSKTCRVKFERTPERLQEKAKQMRDSRLEQKKKEARAELAWKNMRQRAHV